MKSELIENRIIVWDIDDSRKLFSQGYYGKPIGIPKPKLEEIDVPLILDLIEGLYLLENKKITITKSKQKVTIDQMIEICKKDVCSHSIKLDFHQSLGIKFLYSVQYLLFYPIQFEKHHDTLL